MSDVATQAVEVKVPDIGDFSDVPIIEVHVAPGDAVMQEDPLVTLESDKATMDVPSPKVDFEKFGPVERVALSRIKRISGPALHRNWVMIPHVTHNDEADITELEAFRKRTNDEIAKSGVKITMVALLLKACIPALQRFPELNSSLDGDELILKRYYNIGFAADTPQGLVVPVIKDADRKGLVEIAQE